MRKPYQGVLNIVRFNRHFYVASGIFFVCGLVAITFLSGSLYTIALVLLVTGTIAICVSLVVAWYIYDYSGFYNMDWLEAAGNPRLETGNILNMHAGFDETSETIKQRFPRARLQVYDFYDPVKHTEVSIRRARKAYPPFRDTVQVTTGDWYKSAGRIDLMVLVFAAHEIRNKEERNSLFRHAAGQLAPGGQVMVTEHLRDLANFLAFNIGFLHFYAAHTWLATFKTAGLKPVRTIRNNAWVTTYILEKV